MWHTAALRDLLERVGDLSEPGGVASSVRMVDKRQSAVGASHVAERCVRAQAQHGEHSVTPRQDTRAKQDTAPRERAQIENRIITPPSCAHRAKDETLGSTSCKAKQMSRTCLPRAYSAASLGVLGSAIQRRRHPPPEPDLRWPVQGTWPPSESMNVGMHSSSAHVHETHSREFSEATKTFLKVAFQADRFPSAKTRRLLATQLNLSHRQVQGASLHILMVSPLTPPLACSARVPCM